jgi:hypothetical protein
MSKQFFYTRTEKVKDGEDNHFTDSFNMDLVIRTYDMGEHLIILLADGHEMSDDVPVMTKDGRPQVKNGGIVTKRERRWRQSEINLYGNDIAAFQEAAK